MITVYGSNVTYEDLEKVPLKRPKGSGAYWQGIQHGELVGAIMDEIKFRKWEIKEAKFSLSNDGADLAGAFDISIPDVEPPGGQSLSLGLLTSNAMKRKLSLVVGTTVAVCNNGMATGEIVLNRKHTKRFDLYDNISEALTSYENKARQIPTLVAKLKERELTPTEAEHILIEAGRKQLLPWSRLGDVDKEFRNPRFEEHAGGTCWTMMNAFTWVVKRSPPLRQMDSMNRFRQLLPIDIAA